jgi:hypothetical protein
MGLLSQSDFLARYFFDPVAPHSSEPDRDTMSGVANVDMAKSFFGLPESAAERLMLRSNDGAPLFPLTHTFIAQRFQKAGMQMFVEDANQKANQEKAATPYPNQSSPSHAILLDPTIVPGDGAQGCVALTAVGLLARTIGADRIIPADKIQPLPLAPTSGPNFTAYIPQPSSSTTTFELDGTGFKPSEQVTVRLSGNVVGHTTAYRDGSFDLVLTAPVGTYTVEARGDTSNKSYQKTVDLSIQNIQQTPSMATSTACKPVAPINAA